MLSEKPRIVGTTFKNNIWHVVVWSKKETPEIILHGQWTVIQPAVRFESSELYEVYLSNVLPDDEIYIRTSTWKEKLNLKNL